MDIAFKKEWYEQIKDFDESIKAKICLAVVQYIYTGIVIDMSDVERMGFLFIKKDIDKELSRAKNIAERNRKNGAKGGRPKKTQTSQEITQENPNNPSGFEGNSSSNNVGNECVMSGSNCVEDGSVKTQKNPNETQNNPSITQTKPKGNPKNPTFEKEEVPPTPPIEEKINKKETSTDVDAKKDGLSLFSGANSVNPVNPTPTEFERFNEWLKKNCPFVLRVQTQLTEEEYKKLVSRYTKKELCDALSSLNNWKDFPKKRTNVYRSTLDELKKMFGVK